MKNTTPLPSKEYLNDTFTYDPLTGELFWKERPVNHFKTKDAWLRFKTLMAGKRAGFEHRKKSGKVAVRVEISTNGKAQAFYAHRIIYVLMGMEIPEGYDIDHHDRDGQNNRWTNLRLATPAQNQANRGRPCNKKYDFKKGVHKSRKGFRSVIQWNGKRIHLGYFETPEAAHEAYSKKAYELNGAFARTN